MNYRALAAFGISMALFSVHAHAQNDEDEEEPAEAPKTGDAAAKDEAGASAEASANLAGKAKPAEPTAAAQARAVDNPAADADASDKGVARPPVYGKREDWAIVPYGYARFDAIVDSTQSFDDGLQPNLIQRAGTYRGDHRRAIFTARDSRFGFAVSAPKFEGIKSSAVVEVDFYGLQISDAKKHDQVVFGPLRVRHAYAKFETSIVDVLGGQYFDVFGWGSTFYPATVGYLGVPGEIYHRNPQLRLEKKLRAGDLEVAVAAAAVRPGQRDGAGIPDGQGGIKVSHAGWSGISTAGFGRPAVVPFSIGISGLFRHFEVPVFLPEPGSEAQTTNGYGLAAQALLPLIPAKTLDDKANSLTVTGEFSVGKGIAEMYSGMDGGSRFPIFPNPTGRIPAFAYPQNVDPGLVTFDRTNTIKTIEWKAFVAGLQYYLPIGNGRVWVSGIYSRIWSNNIRTLTPQQSYGGIFTKMEYIDGSVGVDITPALAVGLSFQTLKQTFGDLSAPTPIFGAKDTPGVIGSPVVAGTGGVAAHARNNRAQLSMALFF